MEENVIKDNFIVQLISEPIHENDNCEVFTQRFEDGSICDGQRFPDISAQRYEEYMFKSGVSDSEYKKYLRENNMQNITDYNPDGVEELYLVLEDGLRQRRIIFKSVYDSDRESY